MCVCVERANEQEQSPRALILQKYINAEDDSWSNNSSSKVCAKQACACASVRFDEHR